MTRGIVIGLAMVAALSAPASAGERALFTLAIGYNGLPPTADGATLQPLRFADDDAVRVYSLGRQMGRWSRLLALLDSETAARFPELTSQALPPSRQELRRAVAELRAAAAAAVAAFSSATARRSSWRLGGSAWLLSSGKRAAVSLSSNASSRDQRPICRPSE